MIFLQYFLSNLILLPTALMCLLPMKNQLRGGLRRTLLVGGALITALAAVTAWAETAYDLGGNALLAPVLVICFLLYRRSVRAPVSKLIAVFSFAVSLLSILSNLSTCTDALLGLTYSKETDLLYSAAIYTGLGCAFVLPLTGVFAKYGSRVADHAVPPRVWITITLLFSAVFGMNMYLRTVQEAMFDNRVVTLWLLAVFCIMLVLWSLLLASVYVTIWDMKTAAEERERGRLFEMQAYQYNSQQNYIKTSERTRHDFRHSINMLCGLYEAGDYDALGQYLRQYAAELPVKEITVYTDNTVLNAQLNYFAHVSRLNGIDFQVSVKLPSALPLSDVELCGMVGNILENAVIACKRAEEKRIRLTILAEGGAQLYIVATNTFDGYVRRKNGVYLSTNRNGSGVGLASIAATAEKYGGVAQFYHEGKEFFSNIAIPLPEQGKEESL
ncbi:MAG: GHKL domain-containing protein [Clostridia bacterium]|nr:GHKL domain-containing protein [Clostridia bacterium]